MRRNLKRVASLILSTLVVAQLNAKVLLFEKTGLSTGTHTIRVFCDSPIIDIDYFAVAL